MSKDPNQGEGDRASARRYDDHVSEFVAEGKVDEAAHEARTYVELEPEDAAQAERESKRPPRHHITVDELVEKGHTWLERARRAAHRVRAKLARN